MSTKKAPPVGPFSNPRSLQKLDGRTRESRLLQNTRSELVAHVGGSPNAVQCRLIDRAAVLSLRIALMDAKSENGELSEAQSRTYLAWSNSLCRTLAQLGMKAASGPRVSLADYLAAKPASKAGDTK